MNPPSRSPIDPAKILGPYPLLAAFLLVIETLLGFWLFRAESSSERIVAGLLMVVIFGGFLFTVIRIGQQDQSKTIAPQGLGVVTPANEETTVQQIETPAPEKVIAPDRSYTIDRPPDEWTVREMTVAEWMGDNLGVQNPTVRQNLLGGEGQEPEILVFQTRSLDYLVPIPGKTLIDGVRVPTALETPLLTQLAIVPADRAQPPFYVERPLVHNFFSTVAMIFSTNVLTLYNTWTGLIPNTQRQQIVAEFRQNVDHVLLNDQEVDRLAVSIVLFGVEGDIRDYILILRYPSLPDARNEKIEKDLEVMRSLIRSFRPVKVLNPEKQLQQYRQMAEQEFDTFIHKNSQNMFTNEFSVLLLRVSGLDLNHPEHLARAVKMLEPFKSLAEQIQLEDEELDPLWAALDQAHQGNYIPFKAELAKWIEYAQKSEPEADEDSDQPALSG